MIYALDSNENKIKALPKTIATCPICKKQVISKCGAINIWHFAHQNIEDCDNWSEGETQWHLNWKSQFNKEEQEVIIGKHRADININNLIIELQNSSISPFEIREREQHYNNMIWIFKISPQNFSIRNFDRRTRIEYPNNFVTFRWKHPKQSIWECTKPIYIDFDDESKEILKINRIHPNIPCGGSGWIIQKQELIDKLKKYRG